MDQFIKLLEAKWFWFPFGNYVIDKATGRVNLKKGLLSSLVGSGLGALLLILIILLLYIPVMPLMEGFLPIFFGILAIGGLIVFVLSMIFYLSTILILKTHYSKSE